MAIYQFYGKGLIVNGEEHGAADTLDEEELYFWDYWTTPVLEDGLMKGDVNADGAVNLNDAVAILLYIALSAKYPLEADALAVMMVDAVLLQPDKLTVISSDI